MIYTVILSFFFLGCPLKVGEEIEPPIDATFTIRNESNITIFFWLEGRKSNDSSLAALNYPVAMQNDLDLIGPMKEKSYPDSYRHGFKKGGQFINVWLFDATNPNAVPDSALVFYGQYSEKELDNINWTITYP